MKKRIVAALIMIPLTVAVLLAGNEIVLFAVTLLSLAASYEISLSYGFNMKDTPMAFIYLMASPLISGMMTLSILKTGRSPEVTKLIFFAYLTLGFIIILFNHAKIKVRNVMSAMALCSVITFFFMHAVNIRTDFELGREYLWIVPVGACLTDTFALFVGKYFGKRKLAPEISPKKTVAGSVGGSAGAVLSVLLYGGILKITEPGIGINFALLALLGFLCSLFAQLGDLSMSAVKREAGIKDYGNIIPGHGGILDRIDSVVFTAPLVYYFLLYFPVFY